MSLDSLNLPGWLRCELVILVMFCYLFFMLFPTYPFPHVKINGTFCCKTSHFTNFDVILLFLFLFPPFLSLFRFGTGFQLESSPHYDR